MSDFEEDIEVRQDSSEDSKKIRKKTRAVSNTIHHGYLAIRPHVFRPLAVLPISS